MELVFTLRDEDAPLETALIRQGLEQAALEQSELPREALNVFCYDGTEMVGGISGHIVGHVCHLKLLWVHADYRHQDIGTELLLRAESRARDKGCKVSFVDTLSYQAPGFYLHHGYKEETRIVEFLEGHDRVFYKKEFPSL